MLVVEPADVEVLTRPQGQHQRQAGRLGVVVRTQCSSSHDPGRVEAGARQHGRPPLLARPWGLGPGRGGRLRHDGPVDGLPGRCPTRSSPGWATARPRRRRGPDAYISAADSGMASLCQTRVAPPVSGPNHPHGCPRHRLDHAHRRARPQRRDARLDRAGSRLAPASTGSSGPAGCVLAGLRRWHMLYRFADGTPSPPGRPRPSGAGGWAPRRGLVGESRIERRTGIEAGSTRPSPATSRTCGRRRRRLRAGSRRA